MPRVWRGVDRGVKSTAGRRAKMKSTTTQKSRGGEVNTLKEGCQAARDFSAAGERFERRLQPRYFTSCSSAHVVGSLSHGYSGGA
jgi:hypothetical protein